MLSAGEISEGSAYGHAGANDYDNRFADNDNGNSAYLAIALKVSFITSGIS